MAWMLFSSSFFFCFTFTMTTASPTTETDAFQNQYYPRQVECSSSPTTSTTASAASPQHALYGYISIQDMNLDMLRAASWIAPPLLNPPLERYIYTICPGTVLQGQEQLTPLLHNSYIRCGGQGHRHDDCIIEGGTTQILLYDSMTTTSTTASTTTSVSTTAEPTASTRTAITFDDTQSILQGTKELTQSEAATTTPLFTPEHPKRFIFQGITFQDSQDVSVAAIASSTTRAEFYDCHWKVCFVYVVVIPCWFGSGGDGRVFLSLKVPCRWGG
jgi:hypothetical protein